MPLPRARFVWRRIVRSRRTVGAPYGRHPSQARHTLALGETVIFHRRLVVP